ncbi:hypothetical protein ACFXG1_33140, partial [Streptomyces sp. NPDC059248]|uniref:hypothetical protein n=1 Tax=Streptomyces sp. NPDC059248 TaxID=3346791 RepID=UPI0036836381
MRAHNPPPRPTKAAASSHQATDNRPRPSCPAPTRATPASSAGTAPTRTLSTRPARNTTGEPPPPDQAAGPAPSAYTVLHDPEDLIEEQLPLDRHPYESLVKAVLTWTTQDTLTSCDYQQIALQLTGHARAVASDVRRQADRLPKGTGERPSAVDLRRERYVCLTSRDWGTAR